MRRLPSYFLAAAVACAAIAAAAHAQDGGAPAGAETEKPGYDLSMMQVAIEARVVEVNENRSRDLGVDSIFDRRTGAPSTLEVEGAASKFRPNLDALPGLVFDPSEGYVLSQSSQTPGLNLEVVDEGNYGQLTGKLRALVERGDAEIRSRPIVVALNGTPAIIETVDEIPFQDIVHEKGTYVLIVKFEKVGIKLTVTPSIQEPLEKELVELDLSNIEVSGVSRYETVRQVNRPVFVTSNANTKVVLHNRETLLIGGLKSRREVVNENRVPILGALPLVGWFFRSEHRELRDTDIVFSITPHILPPGTNPILPFDFTNRAILDEPLASPTVDEPFDALE